MIRLYADDKVVDERPEESDFAVPIWMDPHCKGCGAPMIRDEQRCEYCGRKRELKQEEEK